jgi:hypothetical protein
MLQGKGIILKGRMPVRLGQMPGVTRFRKKAKVGELKPLDHFPLFLKYMPVRPLLEVGVDKNQQEEDQNIAGQKNQKPTGFSHIIRPALLFFHRLSL